MYPKVRFRGFDEPWKTKNVSSTFDIITDYVANGSFESLRKNVVTYKSYNYAYMIRLQDASNNWQGPWLYTDKKGYNFLSKSKLFPGDIVMSNVGSVGLFYLIPDLGKPMTLAPNSILLRSSFENNRFLFSLMNSNLIKTQIEKEKSPGAQPKINKTDFKKIKLVIPQRTEQNVIANLFKVIDSLLSLQQRKLELEKQLELYVTDDLLVYETESKIIPKVRFNSFCQSWKKVKLKEIIGKIQSGNRLPKTNLEEGSIPYILAQSKNNGIYMYISKDTLDFNGNALKLFPADSITFSIDNPQAIYYQPEPFYTSNIMRVIHSQHLNKFDYMFIIMNLKKYTKEFDWSRKFSGPVVSNLQVSIPGNIDERRKIGKLICKIQLHRLLDEKAKREIIKLKRFLLQNLFI
ncbi:restriction endonuclease subunit S [Lactobacillus mulieris]|uniref:restriction endonuclease subunit S n=1 Tax=Lactobacillus mulieris TaxID=2508708 RepID=UPI0022AC35FD|nr:restriction endonuclease subunit S [Lactobacillus mulieris]MCZ3710745.1 restriction endonuclease subunit S [Lactobacillus mulieris]MCZ3722836.1 restriction endonuclease subunit S [Lactobacillus mulieris]MDT9629057.1 restriction endonuclease subunit S [Lactobacillus mulieris]